MASVDDITIPPGTWVDITTAFGAFTGERLYVQNTSNYRVRVAVDTNEPAQNDTGVILTPYSAATAEPNTGEKVWARSGSTASLHVGEV